MRKPRYPIFIPSKGRAENMLTAKMFDEDGVDYFVVVEPSQVEAYSKVVKSSRLLVMPDNDGGIVYARNWISDYARNLGIERHWQWDDDCKDIYWINRGYRVRCDSALALAAAEDFADRYENVGLLSLNSVFFVPASRGVAKTHYPPFYLNHRCYTDILFLNKLPNRWRGPNNEDTDMSLQVIADGWCTVLLNVFSMWTATTLTNKGGQTASAYANDGRLRMVRGLQRKWPGVVTIGRRFQHPQHFIKDEWRKFDTPLKPKAGLDISKLPPIDDSLKLTAIRKVKSPYLRKLMDEVNSR